MFDLTGEVAVVIGATGALGGSSALAMAKAGAKIAVVGRSAERGEARVQEISDAGGQAQFFSCDAMDPASLKSCHDAIGQALGSHIDGRACEPAYLQISVEGRALFRRRVGSRRGPVFYPR